MTDRQHMPPPAKRNGARSSPDATQADCEPTATALVDLEEIRHLRKHGSETEISARLQSLLDDHFKGLHHLRELRMAGVNAKLSEAEQAEIDEAADEMHAALLTIGEAIAILRE